MAESFPAAGVERLGAEADVVRHGEQPLEDPARLLDASSPGVDAEYEAVEAVEAVTASIASAGIRHHTRFRGRRSPDG